MSVCHCGIAFVEKNGVRWCRHCDEPCPHKVSRCDLCRNIAKTYP